MSKASLLEQRLEVLEKNFQAAMSEFRIDLKNLDNPQSGDKPSEKESKRDFENPMSWVETWEDICECKKIDPVSFAEKWKDLEEDEFAYKQLKIITSVITNNHKFDFDTIEAKWYIWWDLSGSGFAFSAPHCNHWGTRTDVAARLYLRSEIEAKFCATKFIKIYEKYIKK